MVATIPVPLAFMPSGGPFGMPSFNPAMFRQAVKVVGGNSFERTRVIAALKEVLRTPRGKEIKNTIRAGGVQKTISILPGSGLLETTNPNLIRIDPYLHPQLYSASGVIVGNLRRIIGHELGHTIGIYDVGPGQMMNVNQTENPIMGALGMPLRTAYPLFGSFSSSLLYY